MNERQNGYWMSQENINLSAPTDTQKSSSGYQDLRCDGKNPYHEIMVPNTRTVPHQNYLNNAYLNFNKYSQCRTYNTQQNTTYSASPGLMFANKYGCKSVYQNMYQNTNFTSAVNASFQNFNQNNDGILGSLNCNNMYASNYISGNNFIPYQSAKPSSEVRGMEFSKIRVKDVFSLNSTIKDKTIPKNSDFIVSKEQLYTSYYSNHSFNNNYLNGTYNYSNFMNHGNTNEAFSTEHYYTYPSVQQSMSEGGSQEDHQEEIYYNNSNNKYNSESHQFSIHDILKQKQNCYMEVAASANKSVTNAANKSITVISQRNDKLHGIQHVENQIFSANIKENLLNIQPVYSSNNGISYKNHYPTLKHIQINDNPKQPLQDVFNKNNNSIIKKNSDQNTSVKTQNFDSTRNNLPEKHMRPNNTLKQLSDPNLEQMKNFSTTEQNFSINIKQEHGTLDNMKFFTEGQKPNDQMEIHLNSNVSNLATEPANIEPLKKCGVYINNEHKQCSWQGVDIEKKYNSQTSENSLSECVEVKILDENCNLKDEVHFEKILKIKHAIEHNEKKKFPTEDNFNSKINRKKLNMLIEFVNNDDNGSTDLTGNEMGDCSSEENSKNEKICNDRNSSSSRFEIKNWNSNGNNKYESIDSFNANEKRHVKKDTELEKNNEKHHIKNTSHRAHEKKNKEREREKKSNDGEHEKKNNEREHDKMNSDKIHEKKNSERKHEKMKSDGEHEKKISKGSGSNFEQRESHVNDKKVINHKSKNESLLLNGETKKSRDVMDEKVVRHGDDIREEFPGKLPHSKTKSSREKSESDINAAKPISSSNKKFDRMSLAKTLKAIQKLNFYKCFNCNLKSPNNLLWINVTSGELRCLNCFKKIFKNEGISHQKDSLEAKSTAKESISENKTNCHSAKRKIVDRSSHLLKEHCKKTREILQPN